MTKNTFSKGEQVSVLTTQPINNGMLDYFALRNGLRIGDFVIIEVGTRSLVGVVWGKSNTKFDKKRIKTISEVINIPAMNKELRDFISRMSLYTINPLNRILKLVMRASDFKQPHQFQSLLRLGENKNFKMTKQREKVTSFLEQSPQKYICMKLLMRETGVKKSVIDGLVKIKSIDLKLIVAPKPFPIFSPVFSQTLSATF